LREGIDKSGEQANKAEAQLEVCNQKLSDAMARLKTAKDQVINAQNEARTARTETLTEIRKKLSAILQLEQRDKDPQRLLCNLDS
jgi:hypothetical protein